MYVKDFEHFVKQFILNATSSPTSSSCTEREKREKHTKQNFSNWLTTYSMSLYPKVNMKKVYRWPIGA